MNFSVSSEVYASVNAVPTLNHAYPTPSHYLNHGQSINDKNLMKNLILECLSNDIHYKAWEEITNPFPNFNCATA